MHGRTCGSPAHHVFELQRLAGRGRKPVRGKNPRAQPFVPDGVAQVERHVADESHRQLQDVGRRRRSVATAPAASAQDNAVFPGRRRWRSGSPRHRQARPRKRKARRCRGERPRLRGRRAVWHRRSYAVGRAALGRIRSAPTQSRPIWAIRSKAPVDAAPKRRAARARMASLSGNRWSKYARTMSPRCRVAPEVKGSESDRGRPCGAEHGGGLDDVDRGRSGPPEDPWLFQINDDHPIEPVPGLRLTRNAIASESFQAPFPPRADRVTDLRRSTAVDSRTGMLRRWRPSIPT